MRQKVQPHSALKIRRRGFFAESALLKTKLQRILTFLNQGLVEREGAVKGRFAHRVGGRKVQDELGPPWTGKVGKFGGAAHRPRSATVKTATIILNIC